MRSDLILQSELVCIWLTAQLITAMLSLMSLWPWNYSRPHSWSTWFQVLGWQTALSCKLKLLKASFGILVETELWHVLQRMIIIPELDRLKELSKQRLTWGREDVWGSPGLHGKIFISERGKKKCTLLVPFHPADTGKQIYTLRGLPGDCHLWWCLRGSSHKPYTSVAM